MSTPKLSPDWRILRFREYEEKLARMQTAVADDARAHHAAHWNQNSEHMVADTVTRKRFEGLKAQRDLGLEQRRAKLAAKLSAEDENYRLELNNSRETPEARRARLGAQARKLAAAREAERQALAEELLDRHFRENCDPLRERISQATVIRTAEERYTQIEEHMQARAKEAHERQLWHEVNELERLKLEQRDMDDERKIREQKAEMQRTLDEHMRQIMTKQRAEKEELGAWRREFKAWCDRMDREAAEAAEAARVKNRAIAVEVQAWNQLRQSEVDAVAAKERETDFLMLNEALAKEAIEDAREQEMRVKRREEMQRYRRQLAVLMQQQDAEHKALDAFLAKYNAEKEAQQDAEFARRREQRQKLIEEVHAGRLQQIAYKAHLLDVEAQARGLEKLEVNELVLAAAADKLDAEEDRFHKNKVHQLELQAQMMAKAAVRAVAADEKRRDAEVAAQSEAAYKGVVDHVFESIDPQRNFGRPKVAWFY